MKEDNRLKAKVKALKKIESTLRKSLKALTKDVNSILKDAGVWYCVDDAIRTYDEFKKPSDRNADQLVIDYCTHIIDGGQLGTTDISKLWTKEDIVSTGEQKWN